MIARLGRREFISLLGGAVVASPSCLRAEHASRVARIGFLATGSLASPEQQVILDAFRRGLRERGYVEGQNIAVEYRAADGAIERFPELAKELVRLNLDLIVASNTPAARAAKAATTTIPIVVPVMGDPVADGLVVSLARPGGNVTGMTFLGPELAIKRLELLKAGSSRHLSSCGPLASRRLRRVHDEADDGEYGGRSRHFAGAASTRGGAGAWRVRRCIHGNGWRTGRSPNYSA